MTEALKTHIDMFPELPEGFAWEVGEPEWRYGSRKDDPAFVAITYWIEPEPWSLPDGEDGRFNPYALDSQREYAIKHGDGFKLCNKRNATHYRYNGKRTAISADLTDLWTPTELIALAKETYDIWQIRLAQQGLYGVYPSKA